MASLTISSGGGRFPEGTSVALYPETNWPNSQVKTNAAPVGSAAGTQSISSGRAIFTGLTDGARYVAYAQVASEHRYTSVIAGEDVAEANAGQSALDELEEVSPLTSGVVSKEPRLKAIKLRLRNDFTRPRAVGLTGWTAVYYAGATGTALTEVTDADIGNTAQLAATHAGAFTDTLRIGHALATYGVATTANQLCFGRASVKIVSATNPVTVELIQYSGNTAETTTRRRTIAKREGVVTGDTFDGDDALEGFDIAAAVAGFVRYEVSVTGTAGSVSFRVGKAQTVVEPETDVPSYGDGTVADWDWAGVADASSSTGWAVPTQLDDLPWGFNDNWAATYTPTEITNRDHAGLLAESGATHIRFGFGDLDAVWTENGDLNWEGTVYGDWLDELRLHGLKAMVVISRSPYWMSTVDTPNVPNTTRLDLTYLDEWVEMHQVLIEGWDDVIDSVEFGNEINAAHSDAAGAYGPEDPADFIARMGPMRDGLKAVNPDLKFVGSGYMSNLPATAAGDGLEEYLNELFDEGMGGLLDELTIHPYFPDELEEVGTGGPTPETWPISYQETLAIARRVLDARNEDIPIGITECGLWDTAAVSGFFEREQAQTVLLLRGMAKRAGFSRFFVHSLIALNAQNAVAKSMALVDLETRRRKLGFHWLRRGRGQDADWVPFTLQNSWVRYNLTYPTAEYRVDEDGWVHIRGAVKSGSSATAVIGTLPEGLRPYNALDVVIVGGAVASTPARLAISATGAISTPAGGATAFNEFAASFRPGL